MRLPINPRRSSRTSRQFKLAQGMRPRLDLLEQRIVLSTQVAITDAVLAEGDSRSSVMNFTVVRSGDLTPQVTVNYTTADGTAIAGIDYAAESGKLIIPSGATTALISVPVGGNLITQANRTFTVNITPVIDSSNIPSFSTPTSLKTASQPFSVTAADINGDGKPDLILDNYSAGTISVLLNTTAPGSATPTFSSKFDFPVSLNPVSVAAADLNGDGKLDLAVANRGSNSVSVLINNTTPADTVASFAPMVMVDAGQYPSSVSIGDLNGDGKPDLIATNSSDNTVSVMLNQTTPGALAGNFPSTTNFAVGTFPTSAKIADLNGDGKPDLVVANGISNNVSILFNMMAPGASKPIFAPHVDLLAQAAPSAVAIADFNGDGKPDIVVADKNWDSVSVFTNNTTTGSATPAFSNQNQFRTGQRPTGISVADINGDGLPDIVTSNYNSSSVSILQNTTTPGASSASFAAALNIVDGTATQPIGVAVADFNGDGAPDIAVANHFSSTVSILLNTTPPGSSLPSVAPIQSFSTGSRAIAVAVQDINGDGLPDVAVANYKSNTVSVLLNTTAPGSTVPSFAPHVDFTTGKYPISVAIGDVNGDGKPDLIVANSASNTVSVLLNNTVAGAAIPKFAAKTDFAVGSQPLFVVLGDLNGDGKPDLAVANEKSNNISILRNTTATGATTPTFATKTNFAVGQNPVALAIADLNGDGMPDIATSNSSSNSASVLLNTMAPGATTTTFAPQAQFLAGPKPVSVAIGDFNGDGKADLALTSTNANGDSVSILTNTTVSGSTLASFSARYALPTAVRPYSVTVADFNGDGKPDVAVSNLGSQSASIMLNTSAPGAATPSFAPRVDYPMTNPYAITSGDINGDGKPDLVTADITVNTASVLINTTVPTITLPTATGTGTIIDDDTPAAITIAGGNNQAITPGSTFSTKLSVAVKNAAGNPVQGATVTFTTPASGASGTFPGNLTTVTALTDVNGVANAPYVTTNTTTGTYSVSALATGFATPVNFTLSNLDSSLIPGSIAVNAGDSQSADAGTIFANPLSVLVKDPSGLPLQGSTVTFTAPGSGATGSFAGNLTTVTAQTDSNGIATAPAFSAGSQGGSYVVSAQAAGLGTLINFSLTNVSSNLAQTTTTLSSTKNPTIFGNNVTLDALVTASNGTPDGSVTFFDNGKSLGTSTLSAGAAHFTTSQINAGAHTITASYSGSSTFLASTAPGITQTVSLAGTSITLVGASVNSAHGQPVAFVASVKTATAQAIATGTVSFYDGKVLLGTVALANQQATLSVPLWGASTTHSIRAIYSGDSHFSGVTSTSLSHKVSKVGSKATLTLTGSRSSSISAASIKVAGTFGGVPTGQVVLTVRGTPAKKYQLVNGTVTVSVPKVGKTMRPFTLKYLGDTNFNASSSKGSV